MPRFTSTLLTTTDQGSVLWNPPLTLSHWVLQQSLTGLPASVLTSLKLNSAQQQWAGSKMPVWSYHCPAHNSPMASQHTPKELNTAHTSTRKFALAYKLALACLSTRLLSLPFLPSLLWCLADSTLCPQKRAHLLREPLLFLCRNWAFPDLIGSTPLLPCICKKQTNKQTVSKWCLPWLPCLQEPAHSCSDF